MVMCKIKKVQILKNFYIIFWLHLILVYVTENSQFCVAFPFPFLLFKSISDWGVICLVHEQNSLTECFSHYPVFLFINVSVQTSYCTLWTTVGMTGWSLINIFIVIWNSRNKNLVPVGYSFLTGPYSFIFMLARE